MKVAVVLSGSVREPQRSLATLQMLRDRGHAVTTFIHTWHNVASIKRHSFSKKHNLEPTPTLMTQYDPQVLDTSDWEAMRPVFESVLSDWKKVRPDIHPDADNISLQAMYYSLAMAAFHPVNAVGEFDVLLRLRFDCQMPRMPEVSYGWTIPAGNDFFGINDQLGWFGVYPNDTERSVKEASAYFFAYGQLSKLIAGGATYGPETLLAANMAVFQVPVRRVGFSYTVR